MSNSVTKCVRHFLAVATFVGLVAIGLVTGALVATQPTDVTAASGDEDCAQAYCVGSGECKRDPEGGSYCRFVEDGNGHTCETYDCEY